MHWWGPKSLRFVANEECFPRLKIEIDQMIQVTIVPQADKLHRKLGWLTKKMVLKPKKKKHKSLDFLALIFPLTKPDQRGNSLVSIIYAESLLPLHFGRNKDTEQKMPNANRLTHDMIKNKILRYYL